MKSTKCTVETRQAERFLNTVVKQHAATLAAALVNELEAHLWGLARHLEGRSSAVISAAIRAVSVEDWMRSQQAAIPRPRRETEEPEATVCSATEFLTAWLQGATSHPVQPARSLDLFDAYKRWAEGRSLAPACRNEAMGIWKRSPDLVVVRWLHDDETGVPTQSTVFIPRDDRAALGFSRLERSALLRAFREQLLRAA